ncbi:SGNH/GDSL hydrolase family protein [Nocardia inohanensis]|uniref:SGNH/GDSL hydrolase family protein n=1 Tax=Nocardia inohanensis TaxID=209246 RepID=UPI0008300008|nr:SGNH/GDSL hydrolase family protein [Nocardia inohanensis]
MRAWVAMALAVAASVSGVAGTVAAAPAEGKELVVLGDSFSANEWVTQAQGSECRHGATSWPTRLSNAMGVAGSADYLDVSCPGAAIDTPPSYTAGWEAKQADGAGAFGPRTKLVALQFGLNDRWGSNEATLWYALQQCVLDLVRGCGADAAVAGRGMDASEVTGARYAERLRNVVTYVKYYAPNARIVLVGYPELFRTGQDAVCFSAFGVLRFVQPRGQAAIDAVNRLDQAQREAARVLGVEFFDARAATAGHGLCSEQSWINDYQDPRDPGAIPFHPSARSDEAVAAGIYQQAGR